MASVGSRGNKKVRRKVQTIDLSGGVALFADKLRESDMALVALESGTLKFHLEKYKKGLKERRKEREDA